MAGNDPIFDSRTHLFTCHSARDGSSWTSPVEVHLGQTYVRDQPLDLGLVAADGRAKGRILAVLNLTRDQLQTLRDALLVP